MAKRKTKIEEQIKLETILPAFEKHRPKTFEDLCFSENTTNILQKFSDTSCHTGLPHMLLYGPSGCGKYTRIMALLSRYFKEIDIHKVQVRAISEETGDIIPFPGNDANKNERALMILAGSVHCEIDFRQPTAKKGFLIFLQRWGKTKSVTSQSHKYLIIRHAEKMTNDVQCALRNLVENRNHSVRLLVTTNSLSKWMGPLKSRFLCIHMTSPTEEDALKILSYYDKKEKWKLNKNQMLKIIQQSKMGTCQSIHLTELLFMAEISSFEKPFRVHFSDRVQARYLLTKDLKSGDREQMRETLETIMLQHPDDWIDILFGDLPGYLISILKDSHDRNNIASFTSEWSSRIYQDTHQYPYLIGEAYYFGLAMLLER